MSTTLLLRAANTALGLVCITTLLLLVAWLTTRLFRKNAAAQHLTWLAAFVCILLIPVMTALLPTHVVVRSARWPRDLRHHTAPARYALATPVPTRTTAHIAPQGLDSGTAGAVTDSPESNLLLTVVFAVWIAGAAVVMLQGLIGVIGIGLLHRRSAPITLDTVDVSALAARVGLTRSWDLRISTAPTPRTAMTWGFIRPVVLLPSDARLWPADRLTMVLIHECAHIRRHDSVSQLAVLLVCALHWYNPAVRLAARGLRAAAERAADDAVLEAGVQPSAYAAELLHAVARLGAAPQHFAGVEVGFAKQSQFEARLRSITDPSACHHGATPVDVARVVVVVLGAALLVVPFRPYVASTDEAISAHTPPATGHRPRHAVDMRTLRSPYIRAKRLPHLPANANLRPRGGQRSSDSRSSVGGHVAHVKTGRNDSPDMRSSAPHQPARSADLRNDIPLPISRSGRQQLGADVRDAGDIIRTPALRHAPISVDRGADVPPGRSTDAAPRRPGPMNDHTDRPSPDVISADSLR